MFGLSRVVVSALTGALLGVGAASAMPPFTTNGVDVEPDFAELPGPERFGEWRALERRLATRGQVDLRCRASPSGAMRDCRIDAESPTSAGFGALALSLSQDYRLARPADGDDGVWLRIERRFDTRPDWLDRPSAGIMLTYWPSAARQAGVAGKVKLRCRVTPEGILSDCGATSETPAGMGFGDAAIAMVAPYRFEPAMLDGRPVSSVVTIPINFEAQRPKATSFNRTRRIRLIDRPQWVETPSAEELAAALSPDFKAAGVTGTVTVVCSTREDHTLGICTPEAEFPRGRGLLGTARKLARSYRLAPGSIIPGQAGINTRVRLRHVFAPSGAPAGVGTSPID